jgi:hypothetical protein
MTWHVGELPATRTLGPLVRQPLSGSSHRRSLDGRRQQEMPEDEAAPLGGAVCFAAMLG